MRLQCSHHPELAPAERGNYDCPVCGWRVMAGCIHPQEDEFAPVDVMTFDQARHQ